MSQDIWIADVLRDIGKFAEKRGFRRLIVSLEHASDEFLADLKDDHLDGVDRLNRKNNEKDKVVVEFRSRSGQ